jgi:hypothetical protein
MESNGGEFYSSQTHSSFDNSTHHLWTTFSIARFQKAVNTSLIQDSVRGNDAIPTTTSLLHHLDPIRFRPTIVIDGKIAASGLHLVKLNHYRPRPVGFSPATSAEAD